MIIRWSHVNGEINLLGKMVAFQTLSSSPSFPMTRRELLSWSLDFTKEGTMLPLHGWKRRARKTLEPLWLWVSHFRGLSRLCTRIIYIIWFMIEKRMANLSNYLVDCFRSKKHRFRMLSPPWILRGVFKKTSFNRQRFFRRLKRWRDLFRLKLRSSWKHPHLEVDRSR